MGLLWAPFPETQGLPGISGLELQVYGDGVPDHQQPPEGAPRPRVEATGFVLGRRAPVTPTVAPGQGRAIPLVPSLAVAQLQEKGHLRSPVTAGASGQRPRTSPRYLGLQGRDLRAHGA